MTHTMRACALTLLAMGRDAWIFVAASSYVAAAQQRLRAPVLGFPSARVCRDAPSRGSRDGAGTCMLADTMLPTIARIVRRQQAKARFKGSISHLEKPKVRILDYPTMGESDGASLRWMGDA